MFWYESIILFNKSYILKIVNYFICWLLDIVLLIVYWVCIFFMILKIEDFFKERMCLFFY